MHALLQQLGSVITAQAGDEATGGNPIAELLPMILIIFGVMYFMVLRPQSKERKQHQAMLDALKRGDEIVTSSGMLGKVTDMSEAGETATVTIEIARNVKIRVLRSAIAKKYVEPAKEKAEPAKA